MNHNKSPYYNNYDNIITIAVDVQNDFCPGGSLAVETGDEVVAPLNHSLTATRHLGGIAIATRDWHPQETPHFEKWPVHCVAQTYGAAFHEDLNLEEQDVIINKGTGQADGYSGFEGKTENQQTIKEIIESLPHGRTMIAIGGLATDYCIKSTVLDALKHHKSPTTDIYVIEDAVRGVAKSTEIEAIQIMRESGAFFATSTEIFGNEEC